MPVRPMACHLDHTQRTLNFFVRVPGIRRLTSESRGSLQIFVKTLKCIFCIFSYYKFRWSFYTFWNHCARLFIFPRLEVSYVYRFHCSLSCVIFSHACKAAQFHCFMISYLIYAALSLSWCGLIRTNWMYKTSPLLVFILGTLIGPWENSPGRQLQFRATKGAILVAYVSP